MKARSLVDIHFVPTASFPIQLFTVDLKFAKTVTISIHDVCDDSEVNPRNVKGKASQCLPAGTLRENNTHHPVAQSNMRRRTSYHTLSAIFVVEPFALRRPQAVSYSCICAAALPREFLRGVPRANLVSGLLSFWQRACHFYHISSREA